MRQRRHSPFPQVIGKTMVLMGWSLLDHIVMRNHWVPFICCSSALCTDWIWHRIAWDHTEKIA